MDLLLKLIIFPRRMYRGLWKLYNWGRWIALAANYGLHNNNILFVPSLVLSCAMH